MEIIANAAILLGPFISLACFALFPPRQAILLTALGLFLFLPQNSTVVLGLVEYEKGSSVNLYVFIGVAAYHWRELLAFRPSWYDLPIITFCLSGSFAALANDLGYYDALSSLKSSILTWFVPYLFGRIYFKTLSDHKTLAMGIVYGGLVYVLPCLFEVRMSPQLHNMLYGISPLNFAQTIRFGGYRPQVFLQDGLAVGLWMSVASLMAIWLQRSGSLQKPLLHYVPNIFTYGILLTTAILCKSTGAIILLVAGVAVLFFGSMWNSRLILLIAICLAISYVGTRSARAWSGQELVDWSLEINADRAQSLQFRLDNENILIDKAWQQPIFGWGGWGRSRVFDEESGRDISVTDGAWIIIFGASGLVGLVSWLSLLTLPQLLFLYKFPAANWKTPDIGPVAASAVALTMFLIDCLPNCMPMSIYPLLAGAISSVATNPQAAHGVFHFDKPSLPAITRNQRRLWPPHNRTNFAANN